MADSYLDKGGLSHFWDNVNDLKLDTVGTAYRTAAIPYGQVDSTSTSTKFTATIPGITELRDGVCMWLKNGVVTSASGFTIDINGLGAKPVYRNTAPATRDATVFNTSYTMLFVYDSTRVSGGCWVLYRGYDSDTNTIGYQLRVAGSTMPMADTLYRYHIVFTSADNQTLVPANTDNNGATSTHTINQRPIDPFGEIYYYGSSTSVSAGSRPAVSVLWNQIAFTLGYSFSGRLTAYAPIYLKCAPQTDGSAIIDAAEPYTQSLPTADDGKIYIYLGVAVSVTNIELHLKHPIYYYKDGAIRLWTNAAATSGTVDTITTAEIDTILGGI